ncbi:RAF-like serine/threonine-protein kinase 20 isoform X1 [Apium graveolens]|uniref:RAF-like serine/threonine-protein kinase 20 isoform X1 n=1 Tax=Apium graveolens TaxID=4045 RepID=UPI003D78D6FA
MAFDQNSIPINLRPLNTTRTVVDDCRIAPPVTTTNGRNIEGFYAANPSRDHPGSPSGVPVYYPATVSDSGFVALGYGNATGVGGGWVQRMPPPPSAVIGAPVVASPAVVAAPVVVPTGGYGSSPKVGNRAGGSNSDQASDDGRDDSVSGKKVKFLCSYGGKIMPRPNDGVLRYVGGETKIISLRRNVSFNELVQRMTDSYGQNVVIKYQLPDEDLDALVTLSSPDDLVNMLEEYERLVERSPDGSAKLRVFLFSPTEGDSSAAVQMGISKGNGQRYIEAVNGIVGGTIDGITRRESMTSATSTQNSDFSGTEAIDGTSHGQVDFVGTPSTGGVSPKNNFIVSQEVAPRLVYVDPNLPMHVEAATAPVGIQMVSSHPPVLSTQPISVVQPQLQPQQQQQVGYQTRAPYFQGYVDPQQEVLNRPEYVQYPSQMGFPPQMLGAVRPVFPQQQYHNNVANITPHPQFIPAVHMSMTPSNYANLRPTAVQPIIQSQQVQMERFPEENQYVQRPIQLPGDQNFNAYHAQVSQAPIMPGGFGWHQAPQADQYPFSDGSAPQQQATLAEKLPRFEECYMCQKALPHAHSDTVAQGQRESPTTTSDFSTGFHSLQTDDKIRGQPLSSAALTGRMGEDIVENHFTGAPVTSLGYLDHGGRNPAYVGVAIPQYVDDKASFERENNHNHLQASLPQCVVGGSQSPDGVFVGTAPQLYQVNISQQRALSREHNAKQDVLYNTAVSVASAVDTSSQTSDHLVNESPRENSSKLPGPVSKEGALESSPIYDQLRQIDGRLENLGVRPSEVVIDNEQVMPPADNSNQEDAMDGRAHQIANREPYVENAFSNPLIDLDAKCYKQNEIHYCPASEVPCSHDEVPSSYEVAQPPLLGIDPVQVIERPPPNGELKNDTSQFNPNIASDVEAIRIDGNSQSYISPADRIGDVQDNSSNSLFSSQDPWNLRHDTHFPPPRPNKILTRKEAQNRDPFGENRFGNIGESPSGNILGFTSELLPDDGVQTGKGSEEDHIKQELQAVAEGVAASVLHTSIPSVSAPEANQDGIVQNNDVEFLHSNKVEDTKSKLSEKANLGFPVSDGIGRLQIIKNSDLEELRELGSGTFGTVYHGKWRGSDVAIKRINDRCFAGKPSEQERMRDDFWNEAIKLADLHHPNVVAFYGVVLDGPGGSVATVTEYMVNGSLRTALLKNEKNLDKRKRLLIAMDAAFGMEYLHGKNIVHFDLKSDNLLVNLRDPHRPICKVGDLGLSKVKCQTLISGGVRGTLPWMAPELLNGSSSLVSEKVDVFSFGIVLWELLTGEEPYQDLHYGAIIGGIVSNSLRPPVPEFCDPEWRSLMERCWSAEPSERPNFTEVANQLRTMASKVPQKVQAQQQLSSTQPQVKG